MKSTTSVLIVEDHAMFREMLGRLLAEEADIGEVAGAGTCATGLEMAGRLKPTLAIVDWMLPDGKGIDLVRELRIRSPRTRIVMISSNEQAHFVREAIELGVAGFVLKRANTETLRAAIRTVLRGEAYYCPVSSKLLVNVLCAQSTTPLTAGERAILQGVARGDNIKTIAANQHIRPKTVQNHLANIKDKLGIHETAGLVFYAIKHGLVEAP